MVAIVGVHFAYLIYVPSGGFLALRWSRAMVLHVPTVAWAAAVIGLQPPCPLTSLKSWARRRAHMDPLPTTGFVDRYLAGVLIRPAAPVPHRHWRSPRPRSQGLVRKETYSRRNRPPPLIAGHC